MPIEFARRETHESIVHWCEKRQAWVSEIFLETGERDPRYLTCAHYSLKKIIKGELEAHNAQITVYEKNGSVKEIIRPKKNTSLWSLL